MTDEEILVTTEPESAGMSVLSNTLAIIGFVIIAVVVVWGLFNIANISKFSFTGLFAQTPQVSITVPSDAISSRPAVISWKSTSAPSGTYAFLYRCTTDFSFATESQNGAMNTIPCGVSISVGSSTSATVIPVVSGNASVIVPLSVVLIPEDGSDHVTGTADLSVNPAASTAVPTASSTPVASQQTATTPAPARSSSRSSGQGNGPLVAHAASGPADLAVTIIATGYIDPGSGALLMNRPPQPYDTTGVEFDIANIGGSSSGTYYFQAHLPTTSNYTYTSPIQMSLAPGQHVVSTLRFSQLVPGGGMLTVVADPANAINDGNRANNEAAVTVY